MAVRCGTFGGTARAAIAAALGTFLVFGASQTARADESTAGLAHDTIEGGTIDVMDLVVPAKSETKGKEAKIESIAFSELGRLRPLATYTLQVAFTGEAVRVPHCNGRGSVMVDGKVVDKGSKGPLLIPLDGSDAPAHPHTLSFDVTISPYEKRIACGERVRVGPIVRATKGLSLLRFASASKGPAAGEAAVYIPRAHDLAKPGALLLGVHPWNGGPWTYSAYHELLEEADAKDVVLLMPSGLGNSLYATEAEDEVMHALEVLEKQVAVDRQRVSIWGASMGGQGATTIGWHRPDRFAFVASYFGDAKFDLSTYVRNLLPTEEAAHKVNPIDVIENARWVPTWLIHGEDDRTSPVVQSAMLFDALKLRGFAVDFDRVPGMGHEGPLVVKFIRRVVDRAAEARAPKFPPRVTFRSLRGAVAEAYGVQVVRSHAEGASSERDAYVDIEKRDDGIHVLRGTTGITQIRLQPGALGAREGDPIIVDPGVVANVRWIHE